MRRRIFQDKKKSVRVNPIVTVVSPEYLHFYTKSLAKEIPVCHSKGKGVMKQLEGCYITRLFFKVIKNYHAYIRKARKKLAYQKYPTNEFQVVLWPSILRLIFGKITRKVSIVENFVDRNLRFETYVTTTIQMHVMPNRKLYYIWLIVCIQVEILVIVSSFIY